MKSIRKITAIILVIVTVLTGTASASGEKQPYSSELDVALELSQLLEEGVKTVRPHISSNFDYALCYRYLSMVYRDAYAFEYIPSPVNASITIKYGDEDKHLAAEKEADRLAQKLIKSDMSLYDKYYTIYSYLRDYCKYDMHAALNQSVETGDAFSAYGALINGMAVCDGISAAFAMICRSAGLPCIYVAETSMNHSWNAVLYQGEIMYMDITYDMTGDTERNYFMLTEKELSMDHKWDREAVKTLTDRIWDMRFRSAFDLNQVGNLFRGTDRGWELDRKPTRAESAIMLVRFLGLEQFAEGCDPAEINLPFTDVNPNHAAYIAVLYELGLTVGTSDSTFSPNEETSLRDYMTFMLRALGYSEDTDAFSWGTAPEDALGLRVINQEQYDLLSSKSFDRGMMAVASLNTLKASGPSGVPLFRLLEERKILSEKNIKEILK